MKTAELLPLPQVEPERDGISFEGLSFPVGFDEERLLVNPRTVQKVAHLAGLGGITIVGNKGEKSEDVIGISGISSDGSASMGLVGRKRKDKYINSVKVMSQAEAAIWTDEGLLPAEYSYRPAFIVANLSERDEKLRTDDRYTQGLLDPKGHADFLNKTLSKGLIEAAQQRYKERNGALLSSIVAPVLGANTAASFIMGSPNMLLFMFAMWGTADISLGLIQNKILRCPPLKQRQNSLVLGLDRKIGAQALATYSTFVHVRS